jgi:LysR family nitrogen assimilation transcriptional regulator
VQYRQLRYFVKIVEAGSFSRAASLIYIAQPALSDQIAELEEELGTPLLLRSARGVRPTAAGEILYREACAILKHLDQLPNVVRASLGSAQGEVAPGIDSQLGPFVDTE